MKKINIIGAGMAGSILAKLLRKEGIKFNLFDAKMPHSASRVSENLIGLKWYKKQQEEVRSALNILDSIVPIRLIDAGGNSCHHVYTSDLLEENYIHGYARPNEKGVEVTYIGKGNPAPREFFEGFNVICSGVYTTQIVAAPLDLRPVVGHGLIAPGQVEIEQIKLFRPFHYEKLINRTKDQIWYSNSLAVSIGSFEKNKERYVKDLRDMASKFPMFEDKERTAYCFGYRPILEEENHRTQIVPEGRIITGGYKSGMVHYPIQCAEMVDFIKRQERFL